MAFMGKFLSEVVANYAGTHNEYSHATQLSKEKDSQSIK
jgi:hypothetical protein